MNRFRDHLKAVLHLERAAGRSEVVMKSGEMGMRSLCVEAPGGGSPTGKTTAAAEVGVPAWVKSRFVP